MENRNLQSQAQKILNDCIADGSETSLQFCVYQNGTCIIDAYAGWKDLKKTHPINGDTLFPVYSTSKGVAAAAMSRLMEQNRISPDTPVREIWPEFAENGKESTRLRHFLNHTSGLPQRFPEQRTYEFVADWESMIHVIEKCSPDWMPGTKTRYQSLTYGWVNGEIIQRISGKSFRDYVQDELFCPAGIQNFYFGMTDDAEQNTAKIHLGRGQLPSTSISICDPLDELMRQPCIRRAVLPGFNGMASARALAEFYNAILSFRYFSPEALDRATCLSGVDPYPPSKSEFTSFGLGFLLTGSAQNVGNIFGHGGYGGSDGIADRSQMLSVGFTAGNLGIHACKEKLYSLIHLIQREGWRS